MSITRIATRGSRLAMTQARRVADLIEARSGEQVQLVEVNTTGDIDRKSPITQLTEVGAFVSAVREAVLVGDADLAVHSLKDLPVTDDGPLVTAFPERESPWDALVGPRLDQLETGATVGTGSPRREAQLVGLRPDLKVMPIRGNVDSRLQKVADGEPQAAVLAEAGLVRIGRQDAISQRFTLQEMVPAPGQGALAVEAVADTAGAELLAAIDDARLRRLLTAERLLLARTGAGCRSALGALAQMDSGRIRLDVFVADERGPRRWIAMGDVPEEAVEQATKELGL